MIWYLLARVLRSPWKAALAGGALGVGSTVIVLLIDDLFHARSGHGNLTFLLLMLIKLPQKSLFLALGMLNTKEYRNLLTTYAPRLTLPINALFRSLVLISL